MNEEKTERAVLQYLGTDNNDENGPNRSLSTIFKKVIGRSVPHVDSFDEDDELELKVELSAILNQMVTDDLLKAHWGERDYEASYRLTDQGVYEAAGFDVLATETGDPILTEDGDFIAVEGGEAQSDRTLPDAPLSVSSEAWSGRKLKSAEYEQLAIAIDEALTKISELQLPQEKLSQARSLLLAARALSDAPDPPINVISWLLANVDRLIGIAGLLVGVAGLVSSWTR